MRFWGILGVAGFFASAAMAESFDNVPLAQVQAIAAQGDADAQMALGRDYMEGANGAARDDAEAVKWYHKAAMLGNPLAQMILGDAYRTGRGVPRDAAEMVKWYRMAALQDNPIAQMQMGNACHLGVGGQQPNDAQAVNWWNKSAAQGYAPAQITMGLAYSGGVGVARNDAQAFAWWQKAAAQGDAKAEYLIGMSYQSGKGVPRDMALAYAWFNRAGARNNEDALRARDALEKRMMPEQVAEAQRLTRQWQGQPYDLQALAPAR